MAVTIDSLELQIKHDSADAVKGINSLVRALRRLKDAAGMGADLSTVAKGIRAIAGATGALTQNKAAKALKGIQSAASDAKKAVEDASPVLSMEQISKNAHANIGKINNHWDKMIKTFHAWYDATIQDGSASGGSGVWEDRETPWSGENFKTDASYWSGWQEHLDSFKTAKQLAAEAKEEQKRLKEQTKAAAAEAERSARAKAQAEDDAIKKYQQEQREIQKTIDLQRKRAEKINAASAKEAYKEQLASAKESQAEYAKIIGIFSKVGGIAVSVGKKVLDAVTAPIKKAYEGYKRIVSMVMRMILRRIIMAALRMITDGFKTGLEYLYQYSYAVNGLDAAKAYKGLDQLATTALYVKNSIGAAAMPIINLLIPVLQKVASWAVMAANAINQLVSALSGGDTYTRAKEAAVDYMDGVKDSANGANKAAKDLKATILGFDEINRLDGMDTGSGSGGGGGSSKIDYKDFFEPATINSAIKDLADQIKQKIKAGDWEGIGKLLAQKLNAAIDKIDTKSIGKKITTKISNGAALVAGFLKETDFRKIGGKIADFIDGAIEGIRPRDFANVVTGLVTGIGELIIGFIGTLSSNGTAGRLATKLTIFLKTAIKGIKDYLKETDWDDVGTKLFNILDDFVKNYDYSGIAADFWNMMGNAFVAGSNLMGGFIAPAVNNWLSAFSDGLNSEGVVKTLYTQIVEKVWSNVLGLFSPIMAVRGASELTGVFVIPLLGGIVEGFGGEAAKKKFEECAEKAIRGVFSAITFALTMGWYGIVDLYHGIAEYILEEISFGFINIPESSRKKAAQNVLKGIKFVLKTAVDLLLGDTYLGQIGKSVINKFFDPLISSSDSLHKSLSRVIGDLKQVGNSQVTIRKNSQGSITGNYVTGYYTQMKAEGGYVGTGDLFIANEAGPELVGTVGGRTAVASNQEITGITNAVYAMGEREVAAIENLTRALNAKNMTAVITADSIVSGLARKNRRDGLSTVPVSM